ncbi:toll/interleukin-1 receptor domain-containing protein [Catellatospora sp. KI3]|uniref:toll/interleukin-1 receptor domain-containing protein n=1 Tax=Catellatospora sp. KI3 TaxID=3041620 RepID=UPI0024831068|nr:toll/interleukin-1 receptor domain-containing protein [Catellatospora sp. KI3]MDI1462984.1 toll/interleukin-1 receptor domain-containing protein [Catellatospora sp. KI3]
MHDVFICYRSGDDAYAAALLDDRLSVAFGSHAVFRASRSIQPGESYAERIGQALSSCRTVLVLIGPTWVDRLEGQDPSRTDWVRSEISRALVATARVVPVLLSRTPRLEHDRLPDDIAELAYLQYLRFEHRSVDRDVDQIVEVIAAERQPIPVR